MDHTRPPKETSTDSPEVISLLSLEERGYGDLIKRLMHETLQIPAENLRLVAVDDPSGTKKVFAVDASPNGQHLGKYSKIADQRREDPNWYTLDVFGLSIDPLEGMTEELYRAMIEDAQARGETVMPDSVELSHQNNLPWTATILTGESLTEEGLIPIASFSSDKVDVVGFNPDRGGISMRVRAAILIAEMG